jgi:hypothetical protein
MPWDGGWMHFRYFMHDTALGYGMLMLTFLAGGSALIFVWKRLD